MRGRYAKGVPVNNKEMLGHEREETTMDIFACGSRPSKRMGAPSFTGTVWQDPIIDTPAPAILRANWVRFEPGARTAWHTHPLG